VTGTVVEAGETVVVEMSFAINGVAVGAAVVSAMRLVRMMSFISDWYGLGGDVLSCVRMFCLEKDDEDARGSAKERRTSTCSFLSELRFRQSFGTC
jgi:hypothetical protein